MRWRKRLNPAVLQRDLPDKRLPPSPGLEGAPPHQSSPLYSNLTPLHPNLQHQRPLAPHSTAPQHPKQRSNFKTLTALASEEPAALQNPGSGVKWFTTMRAERSAQRFCAL
ncbi:unnamed protein product [Lota lota]